MAKTRIGINHPWTEFGWDFGVPPTDWMANPASTTRPWKQEVNQFLDDYQRAGIKVVRWHLLGDCFNYGTATWSAGDTWSCDVPRISQEFTDDFRELLELLAEKYKGMQLLPVVIDLSAFWAGRGVVDFKDPVKEQLRKMRAAREKLAAMSNAPASQSERAALERDIAAGEALQREIRRGSDESPSRWIVRLRDKPSPHVNSAATPGVHKGGRADLLVKHRRAFLREVLEPLLKVASSCRDQIFAWEVMNEPEYTLTPQIYKDNDPDVLFWEPAGFENWKKPYAVDDVRGFLGECAKCIAENKFDWTVGFQRFDSLQKDEWNVIVSTGNSTQAMAKYRPQFHYYSDPKAFPVAKSAPPRTFIGEFALQDPKSNPGKDEDGPWSVTAKGSDTPVDKTVLKDRLCAIEDAGYELALGWSARAHRKAKEPDKRSAWNDPIMAAIKNANDGKACDGQAGAPDPSLRRLPTRPPFTFRPPR